MKKLVLGALCIVLGFAANAAVTQVRINGLYYNLDDSTMTAEVGFDLSYMATLTDVEIPASVTDGEGKIYFVTSIGGKAFDHCSALTSVYAPSVTSIGGKAFSGCISLASLTVNSAMKEGWDSNKSGYGLNDSRPDFKVTFYTPPLRAVQIGDLRYLLDDSTMTAEVIKDTSYRALTDVEIPASVTDEGKSYAVTSIGESAFQGCTSLKSVSAPSVTTIGQSAFSGCTSLKSVYAPSVTSIGESAFAGCSSLTSVSLPNATSIGQTAFAACLALKTIFVNRAMKVTLENDSDFYGILSSCVIISLEVVVEPHPAEHTTAKVYANGVEVTSNPIVVLSNATIAVVFTADYGYCFEDDHSTARTNTVQATDDPTTVVGPKVVKIPSLSEEETQQAGYEVKEAEVETTISVTVVADPSVTLKSNGQEISEDDYAKACEFYGIEQKTKPDVPSTPTAEDFKVVSKDAQVVQEGEIAVTKESIAAAKAEIVKIANGVVYLGVSVLSNSDITASTAWAPVKFPEDPLVYITEDGTKLILPIPASAKQGFMILQSGDAKVSEGGVRVPVTSKPWYTPTVED